MHEKKILHLMRKNLIGKHFLQIYNIYIGLYSNIEHLNTALLIKPQLYTSAFSEDYAGTYKKNSLHEARKEPKLAITMRDSCKGTDSLFSKHVSR